MFVKKRSAKITGFQFHFGFINVLGVYLSSPPAGKIYFNWIGITERISFPIWDPVSDGSSENKIRLTDFQLNLKTAKKKSILMNW